MKHYLMIERTTIFNNTIVSAEIISTLKLFFCC